MRDSQAHAAKSGSVPFMLRGPKSVRTALAAATAIGVGFVPALFFASPAMAVIASTDFTISTAASVTEGGTFNVSIAATSAVTTGPYTISTAVDGAGAHPATLTDDVGVPSTTTFTGSVGMPAVTLTVPTTQEALYEYDETFKIVVKDAGGAIAGTTTVTILNDDSAPSYSLTAAPTPVTESASAKSTITARLSTASGRDTTVALTTANGTAVAPGDYTALTSSTITILAGSLTGTKDVLIADDGKKDQLDTESFTVNGLGVDVSPTTATTSVSITDAQSTPKLSLSGGAQVIEGNNETLTVTADHASELPITVQWDAAAVTPASGNGSASAVDDFSYPTSRTVTIPAGSLTGTILIPALADSTDEPDEEFAVQISSPTNAVLGTPVKVGVTIVDGSGDIGPTVSILPTAVEEGDSGRKAQTFTATLSHASGKTVKANWTTADLTAAIGNAVAGKDYVKSSGQLVFAPGKTTQTFTVDIIGDKIDEGPLGRTASTAGGENFNLLLSALPGETPASFTAGGAVAVTITDDDAAPTATFGDLSVKEGDATSAVLVPITLTGASDHSIAFDVADLGTGSAKATIGTTIGDDDYIALNDEVVIQPGMSSGYVVVQVNGDMMYEPDETVNLTANRQATTFGANWLTSPALDPATLTLLNDDKAPVLAIDNVTGKEGATVDVTGTVTGTSSTDTTLNVTFAGASVKGSKAADASDFTNPGAKAVTIPAGTISGMTVPVASIPLTTDTSAEPAETIVASGIGLGNVGSVTDGTITIAGTDGGTTPPPTDAAPTIMVTSQITGAVAVSITGKAAAGATVDLWAAPMDDIKLPLEKILTTTANATTGAYSFSRWIGTGYRFQTAVGELKSAEKTVTVVQAPVFVASSPSAGMISLAVQGNPRGANQTVIIQRLVNNAWVNTTWRGMTGPDNLWKATASVPAKSTWTLRAFVAGYTPSGLLPGFSPQKTITIK